MLDWYAAQVPIDFIRDGDLRVISAPLDFSGVNYYETKTVAADPGEPYHQATGAAGGRAADGRRHRRVARPGSGGSCAGCAMSIRPCRCTSPRMARRSTTTSTRSARSTISSEFATWTSISTETLKAQSPMALTCADTSSGRCLTTSSGPTDTAAGSGCSSSTSDPRPGSRRPARTGTGSSSPSTLSARVVQTLDLASQSSNFTS